MSESETLQTEAEAFRDYLFGIGEHLQPLAEEARRLLRRRSGAKGRKVGGERLKLHARKTRGEIDEGSFFREWVETNKERLGLTSLTDGAYSAKYEDIGRDYASLTTAYLSYKGAFCDSYHFLLLMASRYYLQEVELAISMLPSLNGDMALIPKMPKGYLATKEQFDGERFTEDGQPVEKGESIRTVCSKFSDLTAFYRLSMFYSLAFTGDAVPLAFARRKMESRIKEYIALDEVLQASPEYFGNRRLKPLSEMRLNAKKEEAALARLIEELNTSQEYSAHGIALFFDIRKGV